MAGHLTPLAQKVRAAMEAGVTLRDAAAALLEAAGPSDEWRHVDVGANLVIELVPGHGPLSDPADHVKLSREVS